MIFSEAEALAKGLHIAEQTLYSMSVLGPRYMIQHCSRNICVSALLLHRKQNK